MTWGRRSGSAASSAWLTATLALLLGVPTLRLRADYLAIVTIAAAEIIRQTIGPVLRYFGGQDGVTGFIRGFGDQPVHRPIDPGRGVERLRHLDHPGGLGAGRALAASIVWLLMRSPWGRVLKWIREDEDAVRSSARTSTPTRCSRWSSAVSSAASPASGRTALRGIGPSFFATDMTFFAYTVLLIGAPPGCSDRSLER